MDLNLGDRARWHRRDPGPRGERTCARGSWSSRRTRPRPTSSTPWTPGPSGYLLKDAPPDELFRAVRATARGETVLSPAVAAMMVRRASSPGPVLTAREVEILGLLAEGLGNREMARRLLVSEATVKSHLTHVYAKLGVDSRAGAVARAIEQRIIRPA